MPPIWRGDDKKTDLVPTFTIVIVVKWAHGSFPRSIPLGECRTPITYDCVLAAKKNYKDIMILLFPMILTAITVIAFEIFESTIILHLFCDMNNLFYKRNRRSFKVYLFYSTTN